MTDYSFENYVSRDAVSGELGKNEEQFVYVISEAILDIDLDEAIECGELSSTAENYPDDVVKKLRQLADAIEEGKIT